MALALEDVDADRVGVEGRRVGRPRRRRALAERAAKVAEIESHSQVRLMSEARAATSGASTPAPPSSAPAPPAPPSQPPAREPISTPPPAEQTQVDAVPVPTPVPTPAPPPTPVAEAPVLDAPARAVAPSRRPWVVGVASACALVVIVGLVVAFSRHAPSTNEPTPLPVASSAAPAPIATKVPTARTSESPVATAAPPPPTAQRVAPTPTVTPVEPTVASGHEHAHPAPTTHAATTKKNCSPPYYVDDAGVTQYKLDCF